MHWTQWTSPTPVTIDQVEIAADNMRGFLAFSADGKTWVYIGGGLNPDSQITDLPLPDDGAWALPMPMTVRYVRLCHRPAIDGTPSALRVFYPRRDRISAAADSAAERLLRFAERGAGVAS